MKRAIWKKLLAGVLAVGVLTGCKEDVPLLTLEEEPQTLRISVERNPTEETRTGLRLFAQKLTTLSDGTISVDIVYVEDPYESVQKGEADMIYLSSEKMAEHSSEFSIYSSPFYFRSYEHMTMTLNSPTFHELTAEDFRSQLGLVQLGAVFNSSTVLVSANKKIVDTKDFSGLTIGGSGDRLTNLVFGQMGSRVTRLAGEDLFDQFAEGMIPAIECSTQDLDKLWVGGLERPSLTETFHRTYVDWFFISAKTYDTLTTLQQAAVEEASAYLISTVDAARLKPYTDGLERLQKNGVTVVKPVNEGIQRRAQEILYSDKAFNAATDWDRYDGVSAIIR